MNCDVYNMSICRSKIYNIAQKPGVKKWKYIVK